VYSTLLFFPCYSNLQLRRRRWTEILRRGVLGYASPWLSFLWCYGVFRYSISQRVILVFKYIIYIIIILYIYNIWLFVSTFGRMYGTIDPGSCIRWVLGFGMKTRYDRWTPPKMILREVASRCGFTWWLSLPTWGFNVYELACSLHRPTVRSCQTRGHDLLSGAVLSCHCSGRWRLSRDVKLARHRYLLESWPLRYLKD
jgi:hypothetical protein